MVEHTDKTMDTCSHNLTHTHTHTLHTHTYTHTLTHTHLHTHTYTHTHTHTHTHKYTPHTHHLWFHYDFTNTPLLLQGSLCIAKGQRVKLVFSMSQYFTLSEECSRTCLESLEVLGYECLSIICHSQPKFLPPLYDIVDKPIAKYNMSGRRSGLVSEARSILSSLPKSPNARGYVRIPKTHASVSTIKATQCDN